MAKGATLKGAIEREKGVNHALLKQKKQQKAAAKKKQGKKESEVDVAALEDATNGATESGKDFQAELAELAANAAEAVEKENGEGEGWETDEEDEEDMEGVTIGEMDDSSDSDSDDEPLDNEAADEDDLALSDIESLASEDKEDIVDRKSVV